MKGKGRGRDDGKECFLHFTEFCVEDTDALCPKYSSVLEKKEEELTLDDLVSLQFDLEFQQVACARRKYELLNEMHRISAWQDKKDKRSSNVGKQNSKNGKRSRVADGKQSPKRCKDNNGKGHTPGRPKAKTTRPTRITEYAETAVEVARPKSDASNRFWASLEPYFANFTQEHIRFLEEWIKSHDDDAEYYEVPDVGKHYSHKWSVREIKEEQREGEKANEKLNGGSDSSSFAESDAEDILNKFEKEKNQSYSSDDDDDDDTTPRSLGMLTLCLLNSLIEQNVIASAEDNIESAPEPEEPLPQPTQMVVKNKKLCSAIELEKNILKDLAELGIVNPEDIPCEPEVPEDEVFLELRNLQQTLKAVCAHNKQQKEKLLELAKEEIGKQDKRKKLQVLDGEIREWQKKYLEYQKKKKEFPNIEKSQMLETIKKREDLINELESKGISVI